MSRKCERASVFSGGAGRDTDNQRHVPLVSDLSAFACVRVCVSVSVPLCVTVTPIKQEPLTGLTVDLTVSVLLLSNAAP